MCQMPAQAPDLEANKNDVISNTLLLFFTDLLLFTDCLVYHCLDLQINTLRTSTILTCSNKPLWVGNNNNNNTNNNNDINNDNISNNNDKRKLMIIILQYDNINHNKNK